MQWDSEICYKCFLDSLFSGVGWEGRVIGFTENVGLGFIGLRFCVNKNSL